jgi:hypothetical protein
VIIIENRYLKLLSKFLDHRIEQCITNSLNNRDGVYDIYLKGQEKMCVEIKKEIEKILNGEYDDILKGENITLN